jgi:hypothetical protein
MAEGIPPDAIGRGEDVKEMGIKLLSAPPDPARAEKVYLPLQVHLPVRSPVVFRREHLQQVVANRLIRARGFREAA